MYGTSGEMGGMVIEPEEVRDIDDDLGRGAGRVSSCYYYCLIKFPKIVIYLSLKYAPSRGSHYKR